MATKIDHLSLYFFLFWVEVRLRLQMVSPLFFSPAAEDRQADFHADLVVVGINVEMHKSDCMFIKLNLKLHLGHFLFLRGLISFK